MSHWYDSREDTTACVPQKEKDRLQDLQVSVSGIPYLAPALAYTATVITELDVSDVMKKGLLAADVQHRTVPANTSTQRPPSKHHNMR